MQVDVSGFVIHRNKFNGTIKFLWIVAGESNETCQQGPNQGVYG